MDGVVVPAVERGSCATEAPVAGSPAAFADFYRSSRPKLVRGLALTLGDADLAAEAVDEAMARAYERWSRVGAYDDPTGWIYRVGLNWARSSLRRRRRSPPPPPDDSRDHAPLAEPSVKAALAGLPEGQRSAIVCRYYLGLSEAETAVALNIRPGTVKSRLHRGLQALQGRLAHLHPEEN